MKRLLLIVGLVFIALITVGAYHNLTGMAVRYECVDNDGSAQPFNVRGVVTVTGNDGTRESYSDHCINETMLREYSCVSKRGPQAFQDHSCQCFNGRCE